MPRTVSTFLMFEGAAEEAMNFYVGLFKGTVTRVERYGANEPRPEGTLKLAAFTLTGHNLLCLNSPVKHAFTFTPATSLFVDCESEAELDHAFKELSSSGEVLMPLDNYGFSRKFGWLNDRYGVSWQLNLP
jgi:predicted 3-demethylubiquinone-9 3-methyltransferase (glyoxalase superfamily)